jgi:hypothetical protein
MAEANAWSRFGKAVAFAASSTVEEAFGRVASACAAWLPPQTLRWSQKPPEEFLSFTWAVVSGNAWMTALLVALHRKGGDQGTKGHEVPDCLGQPCGPCQAKEGGKGIWGEKKARSDKAVSVQSRRGHNERFQS